MALEFLIINYGAVSCNSTMLDPAVLWAILLWQWSPGKKCYHYKKISEILLNSFLQ